MLSQAILLTNRDKQTLKNIISRTTQCN